MRHRTLLPLIVLAATAAVAQAGDNANPLLTARTTAGQAVAAARVHATGIVTEVSLRQERLSLRPRWEVDFVQPNGRIREVNLDAATLRLIRVDNELPSFSTAGLGSLLTWSRAITVGLGAKPGYLQEVEISVDRRWGRIWEVKVVQLSRREVWEIKVHPTTGRVLEVELDYPDK